MKQINQKIPKYDHETVEQKWQGIWEEAGINNVSLQTAPKPYYNLMMYPYPSAEGLHVGHLFAFSGADIYGRFMRMHGFDVFEPIGFDSGGIHSENFAIKMGVHPQVMTKRNIENFTRQLKRMGNMYDWQHTVDVMDPHYYKWTQWIFTQLFKAGLAYKKAAPVTWCPSCKTTLSDEQTEKEVTSRKSQVTSQTGEEKEIESGEEVTVCERCKTPIERRNMSQWFFRITNYADRLLENTHTLNWSPKVLATQRNWIGKSEGAAIQFQIKNYELRIEDRTISVFTTRPDTLHGVTFFCIAPENPLVQTITTPEKRAEVEAYIKTALSKSEQQRKAAEKEKTGVFTGAYVINPVNGEEVPVWVADYVLMDYGEGAVMGVPAHDERDFAFAHKYALPIKPVVVPEGLAQPSGDCFTGSGVLINSGEWNGLKYPDNISDIIKWLEKQGIGKRQTTYKLRDWNISRQRYWGPPIPMIYCPTCAAAGKSWYTTDEAKKNQGEKSDSSNSGEKGLPQDITIENWKLELENLAQSAVGWYPVPDGQLPVELPVIQDYLPDGSGKSPLYRHKEFVHTTCPNCGGTAERETDVSDTFLDSSWYFLRYPSTPGGDIPEKLSEAAAFDPAVTAKWLPVSQYCGGAEHSVLHLLYSRFVTMALYDIGYLPFEEPFPNFYAHGLIIKDGAKMSKSRGNVINPDEYIDRYGVDVLRLYFAFLGPYSDGGDIRDVGIAGMERFIRRVWKLVWVGAEEPVALNEKQARGLESAKQVAIKKVTEGIKRFKYNTSIAAIMELVNTLETVKEEVSKTVAEGDDKITGIQTEKNSTTYEQALKTLLLLISPIAPHFSEELWQHFQEVGGNTTFASIHTQPWPEFDESKLITETVTVVIQVNGKLRSKLEVSPQQSTNQQDLLTLAKADEKVKFYIEGKKLLREIVVPGKLVSFVVGE